MPPSILFLRSRILSALYGPRIVEFFQSAVSSEPETTYLGDSFMNGAPGSSSAVRVDHAGANISNVRRPSKIASHEPITAPRASPILGSNPNSNVQDGSSKTPSTAMNSCTLIVPTVINSPAVHFQSWHARQVDRALAANSSPQDPILSAARACGPAGPTRRGA